MKSIYFAIEYFAIAHPKQRTVAKLSLKKDIELKLFWWENVIVLTSPPCTSFQYDIGTLLGHRK